MKIKKISCSQFAGVRDKSVSFSNGINVVFGMNESGKSIDEANVAIASEMARWIWAVGCQVEREQGASAYS